MVAPLEKKYRKHLLVTSLLVTLVVFSAGLLMGWALDHYKVNAVVDSLRQSELDTASFVTEREFMDAVGIESCEVLNDRTAEMSRRLAGLGRELEKLSASADFKKADFDYMKRKYFIMEFQQYALLQQTMEKCDGYVTVLYFYRVGQDESERQGYVLDELVREFSSDDEYKLRVFSVDGDYEKEPLVTTAMAYYNVTGMPSLIVSGDEKVEGFISRGELRQLVLEKLGES